LKSFKGEGSKRAFDGYKEADVDDLQLVCYDYIRAKHNFPHNSLLPKI
jgi:hypothetical protein